MESVTRFDREVSTVSTADEQIALLRTAIAAQEALRPTLGDAVVDATLAALRGQLSSLRADPIVEEGAAARASGAAAGGLGR